MKILFIMRNAHYVRNFETLLRALADRKHKVILGLEQDLDTVPKEVRDFTTRLLNSAPGRLELCILPERSSFWSGAAAQLRALRDYSRYLLPTHQRARRCAERAESVLMPPMRFLKYVPHRWTVPLARGMARVCAWAENVLPVSRAAYRAVRDCDPDVVLLTPLIDIGSDQVEYVKACRKLRIPLGYCVASWDNLTNKGLIKALPDRVFVWNAAQQREAVELHDVPADRVVVTGAHIFDHWFEFRPRQDRQTFCAARHLDPAKPILLYTASSIFICRNEVEFVIRWLKAIRSADAPRVREAGVIIRPHPKATKTLGQWSTRELRDLGNVVVFPRGSHMPLASRSRADYYHSLYHCSAVVGINTSAMLEAGIVGRRSFTVLLDEFRDGQDGMVHFQHLTQDGFLSVAESLEEHVLQLSEELSGTTKSTRAFVRSFLRPHGLDEPAAPIFIAHVEEMEDLAVEPASLTARLGWLFRPLLLPVAALAAWYGQPATSWRKKLYGKHIGNTYRFGRRLTRKALKLSSHRARKAFKLSRWLTRRALRPAWFIVRYLLKLVGRPLRTARLLGAQPPAEPTASSPPAASGSSNVAESVVRSGNKKKLRSTAEERAAA